MKKLVLIFVIFFSAALSSEAITPKEMQIVNNSIKKFCPGYSASVRINRSICLQAINIKVQSEILNEIEKENKKQELINKNINKKLDAIIKNLN